MGGRDPAVPRRWPFVFLGLIIVGLLLTVMLITLTGKTPGALLGWWPSRPRTSPRLLVQSPYRNTFPGVKYIGDEACRPCHAEITASYRQHPMGRSLGPIAEAMSGDRDDQDGRVLFKAQGFEYSIQQKDGKVVHAETRRDSRGKIVARNEVEVRYFVGSGSRGQSYLAKRDGFISQSPMTWYPQAGRWGLSPGYEDLNYHFDRAVQTGCLYCHANRVVHTDGTLNRYEEPIFQGHAIGCERCHGPGELHAVNPLTSSSEYKTIVNPGRLEWSLRDAVCEQCHLAGDQRVERPGYHYDDYRPGLPLHQFWTVLVPDSGPGSSKFVGQVEQMRASRCFKDSKGALGCISCHDPHRLPGADERTAYYRRRCLECHAHRDCRLPRTIRLKKSKDDDCTTCHMPRLRTSNIPHTAMTDHRVLRQPIMGSDTMKNDRAKDYRFSSPRLRPFHGHLMKALELEERQREVAIAYSRQGPEGARRALPKLDAALEAHPNDVAALQAKGVALGFLNRAEEGLASFEIALKLDPDQEWLLREAGQGAFLAGKASQATRYWKRAVDLNPWRSDYAMYLAKTLVDSHDWPSGLDACRASLRLNPMNVQVRQWLVQCYQNLGDQKAVETEMAILQGFDIPIPIDSHYEHVSPDRIN